MSYWGTVEWHLFVLYIVFLRKTSVVTNKKVLFSAAKDVIRAPIFEKFLLIVLSVVRPAAERKRYLCTAVQCQYIKMYITKLQIAKGIWKLSDGAFLMNEY